MKKILSLNLEEEGEYYEAHGEFYEALENTDNLIEIKVDDFIKICCREFWCCPFIFISWCLSL